MKLKTLADLFTEQLKDLYSAETQLVKALPKMVKKATTMSLSDAIQGHLEQTKTHVERLEEIGQTLGIIIKGHVCKAMEGLIKEGGEAMEATGDDRVIDAGLIAAAQRVEHYEISAYGTVRTLAEQLGHHSVAETLRMTEDEELAADERLTMLAVDEIYPSLRLMDGNEAHKEEDEDKETPGTMKKKKSMMASDR
jgi:ferritin-like metal-binding protein YciE